VERQLRSDLHTPREDEVAVHAGSPRDHIDVVVFESPLVRIGRWRCPADHPHFLDSGPSSDALFVFPREGVWIEHEGRDPFVADANTVTYYNQGQCYRRRRLSLRGDQCEWFAVAPEIIVETLSTHEPAAIDRRDHPFPFTYGPSDAETYLRQRRVFHHVSIERQADRLFVEEAVVSILGDVSGLAYATQPLKAPRRRRGDGDVIEGARDVIARRFKENLSLSDIAGAVGSSVFHLARTFKSRTGFSLHAYRNQLRLRSALETLREPGIDLTGIALDLGFSSHSHFTETFRRAFGTTPSAVRDSLQ
jgi:AraC family transcriptional regulator